MRWEAGRPGASCWGTRGPQDLGARQLGHEATTVTPRPLPPGCSQAQCASMPSGAGRRQPWRLVWSGVRGALSLTCRPLLAPGPAGLAGLADQPDPPDPSNPTGPTGPDPTDVAEPADPADPADPAESTESTESTEAGTAPGLTYAVSMPGSAAMRERSSWARAVPPRTRWKRARSGTPSSPEAVAEPFLAAEQGLQEELLVAEEHVRGSGPTRPRGQPSGRPRPRLASETRGGRRRSGPVRLLERWTPLRRAPARPPGPSAGCTWSFLAYRSLRSCGCRVARGTPWPGAQPSTRAGCRPDRHNPAGSSPWGCQGTVGHSSKGCGSGRHVMG